MSSTISSTVRADHTLTIALIGWMLPIADMIESLSGCSVTICGAIGFSAATVGEVDGSCHR